jgi:hypothetical protein
MPKKIYCFEVEVWCWIEGDGSEANIETTKKHLLSRLKDDRYLTFEDGTSIFFHWPEIEYTICPPKRKSQPPLYTNDESMFRERWGTDPKHPFYQSILKVFKRMPWLAWTMQKFPNRITDREDFINFLCGEFNQWLDVYITHTNAALATKFKVSEEDVRREAYYTWQTEGEPNGRDREFWFTAKAKILSQNVTAVSLPRGGAKIICESK